MLGGKLQRRAFLQNAIKTSGCVAVGSNILPLTFSSLANGYQLQPSPLNIGSLMPPNALGASLPEGFFIRIIAQTGKPVIKDDAHDTSTGFDWHWFPDGGATFETDDGGWIYVSNSEANYLGGASAIRFDASGKITDAYSILRNTRRNCAGGATPWKTWLSCEEVDYGYVYESDPFGVKHPVMYPALGRFTHEAVAVDVHQGFLYLTEDEKDGCLYRFEADNYTYSGYPDLSSGQLSVARVDASGHVDWLPVPNPAPTEGEKPTRYQVEQCTTFKGGEGIWYHEGMIYFTTKKDNCVWSLNTESQIIKVLYSPEYFDNPVLTGVDNVTVSHQGQVLIAEDGGDMQIVALDTNGQPKVLLQLMEQNHSEITGPAFNPLGNRLYFSSQRGKSSLFNKGITYEVSGPFNLLGF